MSNEHTNESNGTGKSEPENLWPEDFGMISSVPPVTILRQQAAMLGRRTQNILTADVRTGENFEDELVHRFYLVAPALGDYRYQLFLVRHPAVSIYPATVWFSNSEKEETPDETSLRDVLKRIFASDETRRIVQSLIAQSMATATS